LMASDSTVVAWMVLSMRPIIFTEFVKMVNGCTEILGK
jgi:hypothetical protein